MITLHHLWCVKTTRLQTEYVFGEQEKLQRSKSGKQGRQRAKNVLELVCAPPPPKKDSCGLDASHWWISSQQQWWTSTWKLDQFDKEKMLFCSFSLWLRKSKLKTAFMLEGSTKISLNGKLARFKSVAVFFNVQTFQKLVLKWNSQIYKLLSYLVLLWHFSGL